MAKDNIVKLGSEKRLGGMHVNPANDSAGFLPCRCELCQGPFFDHIFTLTRRSAIISATGQDEIRPVGVFRCENCGWVLGSPVSDEAKKHVKEMMDKMKADQNKEPDVEIGEEETVTG